MPSYNHQLTVELLLERYTRVSSCLLLAIGPCEWQTAKLPIVGAGIHTVWWIHLHILCQENIEIGRLLLWWIAYCFEKLASIFTIFCQLESSTWHWWYCTSYVTSATAHLFKCWVKRTYNTIFERNYPLRTFFTWIIYWIVISLVPLAIRIQDVKVTSCANGANTLGPR